MQVYPQNTLDKLEFNVICEQVARYCSGKVSRDAALAMRPSDNFEEVMSMLEQSDAFHQIRLHGLAFPDFRYVEAGKELSMLGIGGAVLDGKQLMLLCELVILATDLIKGVQKMNDFPALQQMVAHLKPDDQVRMMIESVLTENGQVRSTASKNLVKIRKTIDDLRKRSVKIFDGLLRKFRQLGWLRDYQESVYHNRRVFAVVAEHKNKMEGIIHGSSESGNTAFVEPSELIGINNELSGALADEKKEEIRILRQLTKDISIHRPLLLEYFQILADFDLLEAKSKLFRKLNAVKPNIYLNGDHLLIRQGFHPVLMQKNLGEGLETIPLNLELTKDKSILVISGPNAGGKSVALKTVGLLQLMVQSGMLIPVHESSIIPVFAQLLVDIGDDQSIEHQLSTYSSRLKKMKHFLRVADSRSMLLLDEFGTGSDPDLGGAIAESILIHLLEFNPWGIITTHFGNIKVAAQNLDGLRNGSMLFDEDTLEPKYQLELDVPGSSYTFEVARKIGLDRQVLDLAKKKVDAGKLRLDQVLVDLQSQLKNLEYEREAILLERELLKSQMEKVALEKQEMLEFRASQKKELYKQLLEWGRKYDELLSAWNDRLNRKKLIGQINHAANERWKKEQKAAVKQTDTKTTGKKSRRKKPTAQPIEADDRVRLTDGRSVGTVEQTDGKMAVVVFGNMKMKVRTDQLQLVMKKNK